MYTYFITLCRAAAVPSGLRSLDLHGNKLTRVDGLQTLHSLRELILDHNILKFLDPGCFASVPRLRRLHLSHNGLRSLAHLSSLTRLQFLHFGSNRITEVTELDRLTNLVSLTEVWLTDNLVAKKQWYRALLLSKCQSLKVMAFYSSQQEVLPWTTVVSWYACMCCDAHSLSTIG